MTFAVSNIDTSNAVSYWTHSRACRGNWTAIGRRRFEIKRGEDDTGSTQRRFGIPGLRCHTSFVSRACGCMKILLFVQRQERERERRRRKKKQMSRESCVVFCGLFTCLRPALVMGIFSKVSMSRSSQGRLSSKRMHVCICVYG